MLEFEVTNSMFIEKLRINTVLFYFLSIFSSPQWHLSLAFKHVNIFCFLPSFGFDTCLNLTTCLRAFLDKKWNWDLARTTVTSNRREQKLKAFVDVW